LYLVKQVRDEAHRFAITFHRELRGKAMTTSIIEEVSGIGPKRKKQLLKHFGSFAKLRSVSVEEIAESGIVPYEVAEELHSLLSTYNGKVNEANSKE
jgi:excinuclease ABC subunit C